MDAAHQNKTSYLSMDTVQCSPSRPTTSEASLQHIPKPSLPLPTSTFIQPLFNESSPAALVPSYINLRETSLSDSFPASQRQIDEVTSVSRAFFLPEQIEAIPLLSKTSTPNTSLLSQDDQIGEELPTTSTVCPSVSMTSNDFHTDDASSTQPVIVIYLLTKSDG